MYIYIYILKSLRATAVSKGDGVIFEQGGKQGMGRNHQDPTGNARFTRLGGSLTLLVLVIYICIFVCMCIHMYMAFSHRHDRKEISKGGSPSFFVDCCIRGAH